MGSFVTAGTLTWVGNAGAGAGAGGADQPGWGMQAAKLLLLLLPQAVASPSPGPLHSRGAWPVCGHTTGGEPARGPASFSPRGVPPHCFREGPASFFRDVS